jgi:HB1, ASXL, restriction endonuclease HTH domain
MSDLGWKEAIIKVLESSPEPMHYTDIAEAIVERGLRSEVGATPPTSVAATISMSLQNDGEESPFKRVTRGNYTLKEKVTEPETVSAEAEIETADETGLINAFGMYWSRLNVLWTSAPKILGQQQPGSTPVGFYGERGVYLLHDGRAVVYVGRTTDQTLGGRLRQHTIDRLNGRWDRFSWFGVYPVSESGELNTAAVENYNLDMLIVTMEALLIEGLEPPQNRKRGDDFRAVEFLQVEDPSIQKAQILQLIDELKKKL